MKEVDDNEFMKMVAQGGGNPSKEKPQKTAGSSQREKEPVIPKTSSSDYISNFLQRGSEGEKSTVYLNKDMIGELKKIVASIGGDKSTLGGYVEAIVTNHFEQYKEEIIRLFNENIKQPFQ
nr:DUF3408 domain-containing protein [uncultured Draconibacterium sp.]